MTSVHVRVSLNYRPYLTSSFFRFFQFSAQFIALFATCEYVSVQVYRQSFLQNLFAISVKSTCSVLMYTYDEVCCFNVTQHIYFFKLQAVGSSADLHPHAAFPQNLLHLISPIIDPRTTSDQRPHTSHSERSR